MATKTTARKKKIKRAYTKGMAHIHSTFNNTIVTISDEQGNVIGGNRAVGRQFFCQFPDEETLVRCAVMRDFGTQNEAVLKMWEKFKSDALPVWAIVLFIVEVSLALALAGYFFVGSRLKHSLRKKRKESGK